MSMTGGFSFFDVNAAALFDGATIVASTNQDDANYILSGEKAYRWQSVGSDDVTQEVMTITLPVPVKFDRLFLVQHNFKGFTIKYGASLDFTNVRGLNGNTANISEADFTYDTAYYEFDAVTTDTIIITIDTTQIANVEKYLMWFIATTELGTFIGYPQNPNLTLDRKITRQKNAAKGQRILKHKERAKLNIDMKHYPIQQDIDLLSDLQDRDDPFLVWPHGGKPAQFRLRIRGYRTRDIFLMQISSPMGVGFFKNTYSLSGETKVKMEEVDR
ncbi:MAG: hypothetical protein JKY93_01145 [Gammaproteobacteria bacterium]|nr:hypothetical protein [Gammaproteobacteria bacterium]